MIPAQTTEYSQNVIHYDREVTVQKIDIPAVMRGLKGVK